MSEPTGPPLPEEIDEPRVEVHFFSDEFCTGNWTAKVYVNGEEDYLAFGSGPSIEAAAIHLIEGVFKNQWYAEYRLKIEDGIAQQVAQMMTRPENSDVRLEMARAMLQVLETQGWRPPEVKVNYD